MNAPLLRIDGSYFQRKSMIINFHTQVSTVFVTALSSDQTVNISCSSICANDQTLSLSFIQFVRSLLFLKGQLFENTTSATA